jgi:hypothetical protein
MAEASGVVKLDIEAANTIRKTRSNLNIWQAVPLIVIGTKFTMRISSREKKLYYTR